MTGQPDPKPTSDPECDYCAAFPDLPCAFHREPSWVELEAIGYGRRPSAVRN